MHKYVLAILVLMVTIGHLSSQSYSYSQHLADKSMLATTRIMLYDEGKYRDVIDQLESYNCNYATCRTKYNYLSKAYLWSGDSTNASKSFRKVVEYGLPWEAVDSLAFSNIFPNLRDSFELFRIDYISSIDTVLRRELEEMTNADQGIRHHLARLRKNNDADSIQIILKKMELIDLSNLSRLKEICVQQGWPGLKQTGSRVFRNLTDPSIFVLHSIDIEEKIYFYDIVTKACEDGQEDWSLAENIAGDLAFRFKDKESGLHCFRFIKFSENGTIDYSNSLLEINAIAERLGNSPVKNVQLIYFNEDEKKRIEELVLFMTTRGVPESKITCERANFTLNNKNNHCDIYFKLTWY